MGSARRPESFLQSTEKKKERKKGQEERDVDGPVPLAVSLVSTLAFRISAMPPGPGRLCPLLDVTAHPPQRYKATCIPHALPYSSEASFLVRSQYRQQCGCHAPYLETAKYSSRISESVRSPKFFCLRWRRTC